MVMVINFVLGQGQLKRFVLDQALSNLLKLEQLKVTIEEVSLPINFQYKVTTSSRWLWGYTIFVHTISP